MIESKENGVAGASGGCAAGFVSGIRSGSVPKAMAMCAFMGAAVGTYDLAGGQLGWEKGTEGEGTNGILQEPGNCSGVKSKDLLVADGRRSDEWR